MDFCLSADNFLYSISHILYLHGLISSSKIAYGWTWTRFRKLLEISSSVISLILSLLWASQFRCKQCRRDFVRREGKSTSHVYTMTPRLSWLLSCMCVTFWGWANPTSTSENKAMGFFFARSDRWLRTPTVWGLSHLSGILKKMFEIGGKIWYSCFCFFCYQGSKITVFSSVPDPGSGAFLTHGSGIRNRFFPDPGSRIANQYFESLLTIFCVKSSIILRKLAQIFFFTSSK